MKQRTISVCVALTLFAIATPTTADDAPQFDPDFYFDFARCRISGAGLAQPYSKNDGFADLKTQGYQMGCQRKPKKLMECLIAFEEKGAKPVIVDMKIVIESNAMLVLESESGGDFLTGRPSTGLVVSSTRILDERSMAVKMCHGTYLTGDEFRAMQQARKKTPR